MKLPAFPGYLGSKRRIAVELCRAMSKQAYLLEPYAGLGVVSYVYNSGMLFDKPINTILSDAFAMPYFFCKALFTKYDVHEDDFQISKDMFITPPTWLLDHMPNKEIAGVICGAIKRAQDLPRYRRNFVFAVLFWLVLRTLYFGHFNAKYKHHLARRRISTLPQLIKKYNQYANLLKEMRLNSDSVVVKKIDAVKIISQTPDNYCVYLDPPYVSKNKTHTGILQYNKFYGKFNDLFEVNNAQYNDTNYADVIKLCVERGFQCFGISFNSNSALTISDVIDITSGKYKNKVKCIESRPFIGKGYSSKPVQEIFIFAERRG